MKRFLQILILAWSGLGSLEGFSAAQFYYLCWANVSAIERGIQVVLKPIDCNVCSFAVILPKQGGNLIAHFEVPLINAADRNSELEDGRLVARKVEFISKGTVSKYPNRPALVLLKEGGLLWIDGSSSRFFERAQCCRVPRYSREVFPTGFGWKRVGFPGCFVDHAYNPPWMQPNSLVRRVPYESGEK